MHHVIPPIYMMFIRRAVSEDSFDEFGKVVVGKNETVKTQL